MSEEKFSKCGKEKKCKCRISGVRKKKMEIERKFPGKKMVKILLSSFSLVGRKGFRCRKRKKLKLKKCLGRGLPR